MTTKMQADPRVDPRLKEAMGAFPTQPRPDAESREALLHRAVVVLEPTRLWQREVAEGRIARRFQGGHLLFVGGNPLGLIQVHVLSSTGNENRNGKVSQTF